MPNLKKTKCFFYFFIFLSQSALYSYSSDPKTLCKNLLVKQFLKLSDKNHTKSEKSSFVKKVAIENVDIQALSLYTLGELRKSIEKENVIRYQKSFKNYFLKSLTSRLNDYSSSKFEITSVEKKLKLYNSKFKNNSRRWQP